MYEASFLRVDKFPQASWSAKSANINVVQKYLHLQFIFNISVPL